jgi:hypothetical protein
MVIQANAKLGFYNNYAESERLKITSLRDAGRNNSVAGRGGGSASRREPCARGAGRADAREPSNRATTGETSDPRAERFAHIPEHLLGTYGPGTFNS